MTNTTKQFEAQTDATMRKVRTDTMRGDPGWVIVKLSALEEGQTPQSVFKVAVDAPTRTQGDYAYVWVREGEPVGEPPEFPEAIVMPTVRTWATVPKLTLDMKMPVGAVATDLDYRKLALAHFDVDTIHVRIGAIEVAVWLHDDADPTVDPEWSESLTYTRTGR